MNIEFTAIQIPVKQAYKFCSKHAHQWYHYTVRQINTASLYLQNRPLTSCAVLFGANLVFFEVTLSICRLICKILDRYNAYHDLSAREQSFRCLVLNGGVVGIVVGANWGFCKILQLPLSFWKISAISSTTCIIYFLIKLWFKDYEPKGENVNLIFCMSFKDSMGSAPTFIAAKASEWAGRAVISFKQALGYLQDPRIASMSIFIINFLIIEAAMRIGRLLSFFLPNKTVRQRNIKYVLLFPVTCGLVIAGNFMFLKATQIKLHLLAIAALIIASFVAKIELEKLT